ncbi:MAG: KH domain-containing protein, partial [Solirubrobacterales bacterium]
MATGEEAVDRVRDLLEEIVESLELDAEIKVTETEDGILGELDGDDLGLFIGRRGQTIDAVQHLATRIVQRDAGEGDRVRVTIDAAGWRERRREALEEEADEAAET